MGFTARDLIFLVPLLVAGYWIWRVMRRSRAVHGPATREFVKSLEEAERLRATDPGQAKWIEERAAERWGQSREAQSIQVHADEKALARLRERISEGLRAVQEERNALDQQPGAIRDRAAAVRALDTQEQDYRRELAALEEQVARRKKLGA